MLGAGREGFQAAEIRKLAGLRKRPAVRRTTLLRALGARHLIRRSAGCIHAARVPAETRGHLHQACTAPEQIVSPIDRRATASSCRHGLSETTTPARRSTDTSVSATRWGRTAGLAAILSPAPSNKYRTTSRPQRSWSCPA